MSGASMFVESFLIKYMFLIIFSDKRRQCQHLEEVCVTYLEIMLTAVVSLTSVFFNFVLLIAGLVLRSSSIAS